MAHDTAGEVVDRLQAQGDLIVIPERYAGGITVPPHASWREVPPSGIELLRGVAGGNTHTLVADPGTCEWTTTIIDSSGLALGVLRASAPAYLVHAEHGPTGIAAGVYAVRRQRQAGAALRRGAGFGSIEFVAD
jgi:hypothetical protein